jgi:hypothetical protein
VQSAALLQRDGSHFLQVFQMLLEFSAPPR